MLTLVESLSLAGDRAKQNDDACGFTGTRVWVIDGATDLHDAPLTGWASDASWIAHFANAALCRDENADLPQAVASASAAAALVFARHTDAQPIERWQSPIASLLMLQEGSHGVSGLDLGDCRLFALDADGASHALGGPEAAADAESRLAAQQGDAHMPLLKRTATLDLLRKLRARQNSHEGSWTFGIDPACAEHARTWVLALPRPAHLLLMTDGFAALSDRYRAYAVADLVHAAQKEGLQELGCELRAIENKDAASSSYPRFKKSDDATALLMRLT